MKVLKRFALPLIATLAVMLRCIFLNSRGIQYDDAFSIFLSQQTLSQIITGTAADTMPPLYYFLLHFWMAAGNSLWYLRLLSVLLSLGGITFLYLLVKDIWGKDAALAAAFLAAISPLQIYHAQDIRMYALLQFLQLLFAWAFVKIRLSFADTPKKYWIVLIISGALALYTHNLAGFFLLAPLFFLILQRDWKLLIYYCGAGLVMTVLFIPWALMLPGQFMKVQHAFWTPRPGIVEIVQVIVQWVANLPLPDVMFVGISAVAGVQVMVMLALEWRRDKNKNNTKSLMLIFLLTVPVVTFIVSYLIRPVFVARGFLVSTMFFFALTGWFYSRHRNDFAGWFILICFVAGALMGLPYQLTFNFFPRSPFDRAAEYLSQVNLQNAVIINDNKLSYFPIRYFAPDLPQTFLADEAGSSNDTFAPGSQAAMSIFPVENLQMALGESKAVYFVVFEETISEYRNMGYAEHPQITRLKQYYKDNSKVSFNDLDIYYFR